MIRLGVVTFVAVGSIALAIFAASGCTALLGDFSVGSSDVADTGSDGLVSDDGGVNANDSESDATADVPEDVPPPVTCDGGLTACETACVDTQSDTANCGGCGHDCLQCKCKAGVCQGFLLVQPPNTQEFPYADTDGTNLIYSDLGNGIVAQMPVTGGSPILLSNHGSFCGVAVAGGKVAFCVPNNNSSQDLWLATEGMSNSGAVYRSNFGRGNSIAMDPTGGRQFIVSQYNPQVSFIVYYCDAVQCSVVDNRMSATFPSQIVASSTHAYWADPSTGGFAYSYQSPAVSNIIPASYKPDLVAIDSAYIYWVDTGLANIDRMPLAGGQVQVVVSAAPSKIYGLATDGKYVYYALSSGSSGSSGSLLFAPVAGGAKPVAIFTQAGGEVRTAGGFVSWLSSNLTIYGARTPL